MALQLSRHACIDQFLNAVVKIDQPEYPGCCRLCTANNEWLDMQNYNFSIRSADGVDKEETGFMALVDDEAARGFGLQVIADMQQGGARSYTGWSMDIASDQRAVCTLSFIGI
jgi:hypothetical protein